ncbi:hypothetical protein [Bradyrhizobium sp. 63_E2_N1_3]|uniref:hypothetical protein n=1 Tax=Bradyrhizobium sp. 63_E2_N1_3 TaxID=3240373 RepID=UPI003F8C4E85
MDAAYFLTKRIEFMRFFFDEGQAAFQRLQASIEEGKPPFDDPPYSEDPEPPFLEQWMAARTALHVVGQTSVSMLSEALKLYFHTLQSRVIGFAVSKEALASAKQTGWVALYRDALGVILATDWSDCAVDFGVIEQVVLARNNSQHAQELTSHRVVHDPKTLIRYPEPWFASEEEIATWKECGGDASSLFAPELDVTRAKLFAAADHIEKLAQWIEDHMDRAMAWRRAQKLKHKNE